MKIVTKNSNGAVVMIADCSTEGYDLTQYTVYDVPKWDWSLVDLTGVDMTQVNWIYCQLEWSGSALTKRSTPLPQPNL